MENKNNTDNRKRTLEKLAAKSVKIAKSAGEYLASAYAIFRGRYQPKVEKPSKVRKPSLLFEEKLDSHRGSAEIYPTGYREVSLSCNLGQREAYSRTLQPMRIN